MSKLKYSDFKIGQNVTCVKNDDTCEQIITVGKTYKIDDLDFHFYDKICIKGDNNHYFFLKIDYFVDIKMIRKLKLEKINGNR